MAITGALLSALWWIVSPHGIVSCCPRRVTHARSPFPLDPSPRTRSRGTGRTEAEKEARRWESGTAGASWVVELTRVLRPSSFVYVAVLPPSTFVPTSSFPRFAFSTRFFPPFSSCGSTPTPFHPSPDPLFYLSFSRTRVQRVVHRLVPSCWNIAGPRAARGVRPMLFPLLTSNFLSWTVLVAPGVHRRSVPRCSCGRCCWWWWPKRDGGGNGGGGGGASVPPYPPKHEHRDSPHTRLDPRIFGTLTPLMGLATGFSADLSTRVHACDRLSCELPRRLDFFDFFFFSFLVLDRNVKHATEIGEN